MTITKAQALEALDNLDDFARMTVGVDAHGPRETLKRFIEEQAAPPAAQAEPSAVARVVKWLRSLPEKPRDHPYWTNGSFVNDCADAAEVIAAAPTPAAQAEPAGPGDMAVYQAMADRYAALAARGAQADAWISVEDRLPEKFEEVLIAFRDTPLAATGQYTASPHDTWGWCFPRENDPEDTGPITHWQPLPAAPTPAAQEGKA